MTQRRSRILLSPKNLSYRQLLSSIWTYWFSCLVLLVLLRPVCVFAQKPIEVNESANLPSAPSPNMGSGQTPPSMPQGQQASAPQTGSTSPMTLNLQQAEALAIKNNPQISVGRLTALASQQVTREVRSNLWPTATANLTGVDAETNSRITAGALNNPLIYERAAVGATVSQLITDFGRTTNLVASANLAAKAENQNAMATKEQILLAVNQAFYNALQTHAVLTVAQQTVNERQTVADQVNALFKSKLKSELDLSFANVNLAEAKLLLLDAQNNDDAARATLSMVLGFPDLQNFKLVDSAAPNLPPPGNVDDLISLAFNLRPEILSLEFQSQSAKKFRVAERDLLLPSIRAVGVIGEAPFGNAAVANNWYGAVGGDIEIPIFNGFLYPAKSREASLRAQAADERLRDMRDRVARDVRTSWLNVNTTYQRLGVTQQLVQQADLALSLAQTRYKIGLGSIVELSQAQLQQTQAEISYVQADYEYRLALATLTYETRGI
jgi:outer membrane protein